MTIIRIKAIQTHSNVAYDQSYRFHVFQTIIAQILMLYELLPLHHTFIRVDELKCAKSKQLLFYLLTNLWMILHNISITLGFLSNSDFVRTEFNLHQTLCVRPKIQEVSSSPFDQAFPSCEAEEGIRCL